ncbi:hypothetical protein VT84_05200 [Gemmata sp. SH-PL17]|uniref:hypothetical protein n=1 Tax=Gemmata sp. SH-PL17 TaxID=1630693 RepID=UPI000697F8C4|nr:hypothetical protein [Gemmata sp. SH-PL17]AMV23787.1 hypothetical protein VT84_05200 [Gemmata sp. SH-PL17]
MTEADWLLCNDPLTLFAYLGIIRDRKARLFGVACVRRVMACLLDERSRRAVEISERFADKRASRRILAAARREAYSAFRAADQIAAHASVVALNASARGSEAHTLTVGTAGCAVSLITHLQGDDVGLAERQAHVNLLRDVFGNPFRPVTFSPSWRTSTAVTLAAQMYESRDFGAMPILADALQDAGCDSADVLDHCRGPGPHVRGCWVVDLVLGKE